MNTKNIYQTYFDTFNDTLKKFEIITEDENDITLDDIETTSQKSENSKTESTKSNQSNELNKLNDKKESPKINSLEKTEKEYEMKFSVDLATEFSNTINEFTNICSKIVELRNIDKELSDKFYDLYSKIKNLADAASKTY